MRVSSVSRPRSILSLMFLLSPYPFSNPACFRACRFPATILYGAICVVLFMLSAASARGDDGRSVRRSTTSMRAISTSMSNGLVM